MRRTALADLTVRRQQDVFIDVPLPPKRISLVDFDLSSKRLVESLVDGKR
jgi:hypothetical protein